MNRQPGCFSEMSRSPAIRRARTSPSGEQAKIDGTWVWPTRQNGPSKCSKLAVAVATFSTYSQIGPRGDPCTSVNSPDVCTSGRADRYAFVGSVSVSEVQRAARAANVLNSSTPILPTAA